MALPPQLQSFVDGPKLPKVVLGLVGLVAIIALGYFFLISPIQARIAELVQRRSQVTSEVTQARAQVAEIERFRREIAELEKRLALLRDRLPSEKETPTLYRAVSTAAEQVGLGRVALPAARAAAQGRRQRDPDRRDRRGQLSPAGQVLRARRGAAPGGQRQRLQDDRTAQGEELHES